MNTIARSNKCCKTVHTQCKENIDSHSAEKLELNNINQLDSFLNSMICGFVIIDPETHKIVKINEIARNMIGLEKSKIEGQICHTFICPAEKNQCPITDLGYVVDNSEKILLTYNSKRIPILKKVSKQTIDNKLFLIESFVDISQQKLTEQKLKFLSYHDPLTELHNRRYIEEQLRLIDNEAFYPISVILGDVNGLKLANDAFGHFEGDMILQEAAKVLKSICKESDIIARWGGDEFIILLPKTDLNAVQKVCHSLKYICDKKYINSVKLSISVGYATKQSSGESITVTIKNAEDMMYRLKLLESTSHKALTLNAIINALHEKSIREEQHSIRVSEIAKEIGAALELSEAEINELGLLGILHDIGKIAINENILNKKSRLDLDEWKEIKRHPEIGYRIISSLSEMKKIADYILAHHEYYNGLGYPNGLKDEEIPLPSRIVAVADAFDAMTSTRSYREAMSKQEAIEELVRNAGTQFDPEIVKIFVKII